MNELVALELKRNRGWPWPDDSYGLSPMYGENGWCRSCGMPLGEQSGPLVLRRKGMRVEGAWLPYGQYDAICLERALAEEVADRFRVHLMPVRWRGSGEEAMQIVAPSVGSEWWDPNELRRRTVQRHGVAGDSCAECGRWRWNPLSFGELPQMLDVPELRGHDIAASPEWFGSGWNCFRQVVMRRDLAELIAAASPRDFYVLDITVSPEPLRPLDVGASQRVPGGAVSEIFTAVLPPASTAYSGASEAVRRALEGRRLLEQSGGLVSADAAAGIAADFFEAGFVDDALSLWRQAADHGSDAARGALKRFDGD